MIPNLSTGCKLFNATAVLLKVINSVNYCETRETAITSGAHFFDKGPSGYRDSRWTMTPQFHSIHMPMANFLHTLTECWFNVADASFSTAFTLLPTALAGCCIWHLFAHAPSHLHGCLGYRITKVTCCFKRAAHLHFFLCYTRQFTISCWVPWRRYLPGIARGTSYYQIYTFFLPGFHASLSSEIFQRCFGIDSLPLSSLSKIGYVDLLRELTMFVKQ